MTEETMFCKCEMFALWYVEGVHRVCVCGHEQSDHLDDRYSCIGDVVVEKGSR